MPYFVNCPKCGVRLRVQDDVPGALFTCPRCLAVVPAPAERPIPVAQPVAAPPYWYSERSFRRADEDIRRDTGGTIAALGILALLLVGSILLTVFSGVATGSSMSRSTNKNAETLATVCILGSVLLALAAPVPFVVRALRHSNLGAGRVILSAVMYVGIVGATATALFVIFFLACLGGLTIK